MTTGWLHWLRLWEIAPGAWAASAVALGAYRWFPGARAHGRALAWGLGVLVTLVSLVSPLDVVGREYLFSAHMGQHLLLAMVAPPLLIRGLPDPTVDRILAGRLGRSLGVLVHPFFAATAYFVVLVVWHVPGPLDYSLRQPSVYLLQHLTFLVVGLLFWWAVVIHREGAAWNLSPLGEVAYLTCGALPSVVVGLTLALLPSAIYSYYVTRTHLLGLSAVGDQHLGGLLMFGFDNILMVSVAGYYFWRLFPDDGTDDRRNRPIRPGTGP